MLARLESERDRIATPSIWFEKKVFFGGYVMPIKKPINTLRDLRSIVIVVIQATSTNINGFVQWNIRK